MIALALGSALLCGIALVEGPGGVIAGLALSGLAWSAGLLLGGATGAFADVILLLFAAALRWRTRWIPLARGAAAERIGGTLWAAFALAAAVVAALFVEHSVRYPDGGWDGRAVWKLRARSLWAAPDRLGDVFSPEVPHPDYPPLLPALISHLWRAAGTRTPLVPIGVSVAFAVAGVAVLARATAARRGALAGWCAALLLIGTPDFLVLAWNQFADLKLAMLLLVAVILATEGRHAAAGLVAALCAWTKNEGLVEAGVLLVVLLARAGPRAAARFLAGACVPLALLAWFKFRWAPPNDLASQTSLADLWRRPPGRIGLVARAFLAQPVAFASWGCALAAVALAWIVRWRARERGGIAPLFVALMLLAFFGIYLVTPLEPANHLQSSLDRLLFQLWPSILYASAIALLPAAQPQR